MTVRLKRFRRATENNALIPAIVAALNFYSEVFAFPVKGEGARGKRLVVPKGTADIIGLRTRYRTMETSLAQFSPGEIPKAFAAQFAEHVMNRPVEISAQPFAIECKATHRTTCKCESCSAQRGWRWQWEKHGGVYILARSPQEAIDGLMGRRAA